MDHENTNNFNNIANNSEKEEIPRNSAIRKIGGFALKVAEVVTYTGVAWGLQELVIHNSLPLAVNVAIAGGGAAITNHVLRSKK